MFNIYDNKINHLTFIYRLNVYDKQQVYYPAARFANTNLRTNVPSVLTDKSWNIKYVPGLSNSLYKWYAFDTLEPIKFRTYSGFSFDEFEDHGV